MPRFSVKKSITVFAAMVIIVVLGVVSYMKMTPDLLPNMDLPYVMLMTTYPGATPEEVEAEVTKPLEQSMATLENISSISSSSSENYSLIILEFTSDANLDTISVDILQKISLVEGSWDDMVGTPYMLKLNPSMLPVRVSAVDMEGMDVAELSSFVDEVLMNKLEGVAGVASISASGMLEQTMNVVLNQDKIDKLNQKMAELIEDQFAEAKKKLEDSLAEAEDGLAKLEEGQAELEAGKAALAKELASASAEMDAARIELATTRLGLTETQAKLNESMKEVVAGEKSLLEMKDTVTRLEAAKSELKPQLELLSELAAKAETLAATEKILDGAIREINRRDDISEEEKAELVKRITDSEQYRQVKEELARVDGQLAAMGLTRETLSPALAELTENYAKTEAGLLQIDAALSAMGYSRSDIDGALTEISAGKEQLTSGIYQIDVALQGLNDGTVQLKDAQITLEQKKIESIFQLSDAATELALTRSQLDAALEQIKSGLEQIEQTKSDTLKKADLSNKITMDMVSQILNAQNFSMPAGYAQEDGVSYVVSVGDTLNSQEELENLLLFDPGMEGMDPIYLSDVADIFMSDNSDEIYAKINGNNGVMLSFSKQSTYATATVSGNLSEKFEELENQYPGLSFTDMMDQGDYIHIIISSITDSLLWGAVFAILILYLFLKDIKPTLITLFSIPISLLFALALMYFSGVTLNMISLSGLAVAVGMLVDNSVVVIENTYRLRNKGESAVKAAVSGAAQVAGAIAASTLTTVCVFLPIVFVEGITRQLFTDMALTIGYALIASLLIALTLVPAMAKSMLKVVKPHKSPVMDRMTAGYGKLLTAALNHKAIVLLGAAAMLVISVAAVVSKGFTYMPEMEAGQISGTLVMPEGSSLEETGAMADEVMSRIQGVDGVGTVGAMVSGSSIMGGLSGQDTASVSLYVLYDESSKRSHGEILAELEGMFDDLDCEVSLSGQSDMSASMSALGGAGVSIQVYGEDMEQLQNAAREIAAVLETVEGTAEISDGMEESDPAIHIAVNKEEAMKKGLTVAQVYMEIASALKTEAVSTTVNWDGYSYEIVAGSGKDSMTPDDIRDYSFTVTGQDGSETEVYLRDIAEIRETQTLSTISRQSQRRYLTVTASVAAGYNVTKVTEAAQKALKSYSLPDGVSIEFAGESETIMEAFEQLGLMLVLGILLVYLVMAAQFQSLKSPFIVMFTIPLAFTGGLLALLITGKELSVISLIGFIMLCGIIVNNGIVLVDYINQSRLEGVEKRTAIVDAGITRMRPILMTSITTILGLIVMALGVGTGTDMMQPIAIVCIGGLIYATLMTLFVVPVLYEMMNRKEMKKISGEDLEISTL